MYKEIVVLTKMGVNKMCFEQPIARSIPTYLSNAPVGIMPQEGKGGELDILSILLSKSPPQGQPLLYNSPG